MKSIHQLDTNAATGHQPTYDRTLRVERFYPVGPSEEKSPKKRRVTASYSIILARRLE